jgi:hypothetical protein
MQKLNEISLELVRAFLNVWNLYETILMHNLNKQVKVVRSITSDNSDEELSDLYNYHVNEILSSSSWQQLSKVSSTEPEVRPCAFLPLNIFSLERKTLYCSSDCRCKRNRTVLYCFRNFMVKAFIMTLVVWKPSWPDLHYYFFWDSKWSHTGGCFWVVQLELIRHAVFALYRYEIKLIDGKRFTRLTILCTKIHMCRRALSSLQQNSFCKTEVLNDLNKILPEKVPNFVTHKILREKLAMLRLELIALVDAMGDSDDPYVCGITYFY